MLSPSRGNFHERGGKKKKNNDRFASHQPGFRGRAKFNKMQRFILRERGKQKKLRTEQGKKLPKLRQHWHVTQEGLVGGRGILPNTLINLNRKSNRKKSGYIHTGGTEGGK